MNGKKKSPSRAKAKAPAKAPGRKVAKAAPRKVSKPAKPGTPAAKAKGRTALGKTIKKRRNVERVRDQMRNNTYY